MDELERAAECRQGASSALPTLSKTTPTAARCRGSTCPAEELDPYAVSEEHEGGQPADKPSHTTPSNARATTKAGLDRDGVTGLADRERQGRGARFHAVCSEGSRAGPAGAAAAIRRAGSLAVTATSDCFAAADREPVRQDLCAAGQGNEKFRVLLDGGAGDGGRLAAGEQPTGRDCRPWDSHDHEDEVEHWDPTEIAKVVEVGRRERDVGAGEAE
jgi:hypothetical protein